MKVDPTGNQSWLKIGKQDVPDGSSFSNFLKEALEQVESTQSDARVAAQGLAVGDSVEMHQVMIAYEKAYLALDLTVEIRNKLLEAYHEIMRIQM